MTAIKLVPKEVLIKEREEKIKVGREIYKCKKVISNLNMYIYKSGKAKYLLLYYSEFLLLQCRYSWCISVHISPYKVAEF